MKHEVQKNGITIIRTPTGIGVIATGNPPPHRTLLIEVSYLGRKLNWYAIDSYTPWREYFDGIDNLKCAITVLDGTEILAELPADDGIMPFMVRQGPQHHVTEAYISVPPALTITDESGAVWTLGMATAPRELSPEGEFAFEVLRDGIGTHEIASRIERRNGKIKAFTRSGWTIWNGREFT